VGTSNTANRGNWSEKQGRKLGSIRISKNQPPAIAARKGYVNGLSNGSCAAGKRETIDEFNCSPNHCKVLFGQMPTMPLIHYFVRGDLWD
jgi:hypothetical protein